MTNFKASLTKAFFLAGALFTGWAAHSQSATTTNTNPSDTTRHFGQGGNRMAYGNRFHHRGGPGIRYTPEQRKQVMAINKEYHQKSQDLYNKDNITLREYKAGLIALQKDKKSRLEALLTPQQKDQIAKRKQMRMENAQVMAVARMEKLRLHLNLTDDQVAKIKTGQADLTAKVKAIRENDNLLPEQKREQLKALAGQRKDNLMAVLTPDQVAKLKTMHGGMGHERHERGGWRGDDSRNPDMDGGK